jgi:hypothetical protein
MFPSEIYPIQYRCKGSLPTPNPELPKKPAKLSHGYHKFPQPQNLRPILIVEPTKNPQTPALKAACMPRMRIILPLYASTSGHVLPPNHKPTG